MIYQKLSINEDYHVSLLQLTLSALKGRASNSGDFLINDCTSESSTLLSVLVVLDLQMKVVISIDLCR